MSGLFAPAPVRFCPPLLPTLLPDGWNVDRMAPKAAMR